MSLIKSTSKLPMMMLEVAFHRSPKWVGASATTIGVFVAGQSYCYEQATDGRLVRLPADAQVIAIALGLNVKDVRKALPDLLARGIWEEEDGWLQVHDFLDHNPSSNEVREHRDARSAAGFKAAHEKWHAAPGRDPKPDCYLCVDEGLVAAPSSDAHANGDANRIGDAMGPHMRSDARGEERRGEENSSTPPTPPKRDASTDPDPPPPGGEEPLARAKAVISDIRRRIPEHVTWALGPPGQRKLEREVIRLLTHGWRRSILVDELDQGAWDRVKNAASVVLAAAEKLPDKSDYDPDAEPEYQRDLEETA